MKNKQSRPSRWWYVLSIFLLIFGFVGFLVFFVLTLFSIEGNIQRVTVPGEHRLHFDRSGTYFICYEHVSYYKGQNFSTNKNQYTRLVCSMISADQNENLQVLQDSASLKYDFNRRRIGFSVFRFNIEHPGFYILKAEYIEGEKKPEIVLAIRSSLFEQLIGPLLWGSLYTSIIILGSTAIFWISFLKRLKSKHVVMQKN